MNNNQALPKISCRQKIGLIIFGIFLFFIILEIGLRVSGSVLLYLQEYKNRLSLKQKGVCRIMCLGESTTQDQYPRLLEEILNQRHAGIKFSVIDKGLCGTSSEIILSHLEENIKKYKPDMVVAMMGINDGRPLFLYNTSVSNKVLFYRHLRAYKLLNLLWLHIVNKAYDSGIGKQFIKKIWESLLLIGGFKEDYVAKKIVVPQDELVTKILKLPPDYDKKIVKIGWDYKVLGNFAEAERAFKKALEFNLKNDSAYEGLACVYVEQGKFIEAEQFFKKALELNPNNDSAAEGLGSLYRGQNKLADAEYFLKKASELNPKDGLVYNGLGGIYKKQGRFAEAENAFKKALNLNPKDDTAYDELGRVYKEQGKFTEAEHAFKKDIEINFKNGLAYMELGWVYRGQKKFTEAEQFFKKAIELNFRISEAYVGLLQIYRDQNRLPEAEPVFCKIIESNPKNDYAYVGLGWALNEQGRLIDAENSFKKALELNPDNELAYEGLACDYSDQGKFSEAAQAFKKNLELNPNNNWGYGALEKAYSIEKDKIKLPKKYLYKDKLQGPWFYNVSTIKNYLKLKQILDKRNIRLVCVEYPMRSIGSLKGIFKDRDKGIIFVDNEEIFRDGVRKYGYKAYFRDMFAVIFGHCTEKGNRLLAENIAGTILKEAFGK